MSKTGPGKAEPMGFDGHFVIIKDHENHYLYGRRFFDKHPDGKGRPAKTLPPGTEFDMLEVNPFVFITYVMLHYPKNRTVQALWRAQKNGENITDDMFWAFEQEVTLTAKDLYALDALYQDYEKYCETHPNEPDQ